LSFFENILRYYGHSAPAGITDISSADIGTRSLFACGGVDKLVDGGYIPSHLIKIHVQDKEKYAILAEVPGEAHAKNNRDSSTDDE
jgi:hypothetical protein